MRYAWLQNYARFDQGASRAASTGLLRFFNSENYSDRLHAQDFIYNKINSFSLRFPMTQASLNTTNICSQQCVQKKKQDGFTGTRILSGLVPEILEKSSQHI
jgi:hypothetical protein